MPSDLILPLVTTNDNNRPPSAPILSSLAQLWWRKWPFSSKSIHCMRAQSSVYFFVLCKQHLNWLSMIPISWCHALVQSPHVECSRDLVTCSKWVIYSKSDGLPLSRLGYKRLWLLSCLHSLWLVPCDEARVQMLLLGLCLSKSGFHWCYSEVHSLLGVAVMPASILTSFPSSS